MAPEAEHRRGSSPEPDPKVVVGLVVLGLSGTGTDVIRPSASTSRPAATSTTTKAKR